MSAFLNICSMLDNLKTFIEKFGQFDPEYEYLLVIDANKQQIVKLQQDQLAEGVDITGAQRLDEYRPFTVEQKLAYGVGLGRVINRVTFFMTGEMYSDMQADVDGDEFKVTVPGAGGSAVEGSAYKYDKMIQRVGEENFGLNAEKRLTFATEVTLPQFAEVLKEKTGIIIDL